MREILFKAKRLNGKGWYYGSYLYLDIAPVGWAGQKCGKKEPVHYIVDDQDINYAVDPTTVCEYTGLTDKNGVKIFEGDIVKTGKYGRDDGQGHNFSGSDTFRVDFEDGGYCLHNQWRRFNLRPDVETEVIGNIHDNPELMGDNKSVKNTN